MRLPINGLALLLAAAFVVPAMAQSEQLAGTAAFGDWRADKPGPDGRILFRH